jgi:hypothetical protein
MPIICVTIKSYFVQKKVKFLSLFFYFSAKAFPQLSFIVVPRTVHCIYPFRKSAMPSPALRSRIFFMGLMFGVKYLAAPTPASKSFNQQVTVT